MSTPFRIFLSAPHMSGGELERVQDAFESNWIAPTGPMVDEFERKLCTLSGIGNVAALSSGSAALHLALRLSDVGPGDEVWSASMTFIGGVAPIKYLGGTPVFFDIDEADLLINLDLLEDSLKQAAARGAVPKVVITTDLYGHVIDAGRMRALADRYGFKWISDAAEAVGAYREDTHAGKGADFAIFSFNGNKIITTSGGGALASDDATTIAQARFLSTQAREAAPHYEHKTYGYNYRLSNICAAIGVAQLDVLEERVRARRRIFETYRDWLGVIPGVSFTSEPQSMRANRWLTTMFIDHKVAGFDREGLRLTLLEQGIEARPLWKPMHMQTVFADAPCIGGEHAERAFATGLCLPSGSAMTDDQLDEIIDTVKRLADRGA